MVSQNNEAEVVINYFNGYVGSLLSLGENDGKTFSNSYDLIQLGWSADLVEPIYKPYYAMKTLHESNPKVKCHNFGISSHNEVRNIFSPEDTLIASLIESEVKKWNTPYSQVECQFFDFYTAHERFINNVFDFITIDCEGMDLEILRQIPLRFGCKCVCVEYSGNQETLKAIREYCGEHGLKKELLLNFENVILAV